MNTVTILFGFFVAGFDHFLEHVGFFVDWNIFLKTFPASFFLSRHFLFWLRHWLVLVFVDGFGCGIGLFSVS